MSLNDQMLSAIMPHCPRSKRAECLPYLAKAMLEFDITTKLRAAAFLATLAVESGEFKWFQELSSGRQYEGRADLGNTHRGDGVKYKGHGPIQITGRANSEACLKYLNLPAGRPELLATIEEGFRSAGWFWDPYKNLNPLADRRQFRATQVKVNGRNRKTGQPNGWEARVAYYERALRVLPNDFALTDDVVALLPDPPPLDVDGDDNQFSDTVTRQPAAYLQPDAGDEEVTDYSDARSRDSTDYSRARAQYPEDYTGNVNIVDGGNRSDSPVAVKAAAPAKERTTKSLVSTLIAGLSSIGLTLGVLVTKTANWLKENPELVVLLAVGVAAIVVVYVLYQTRQTKLDLADRQNAREVTLETMRIRSDPRLINVEVRPRAVPADPDKV